MSKHVSEEADHRTLVRIFRKAGVFFEHPPLGGFRTKEAGRAMRLLGAVAGSPDFRIYDPPPRLPLSVGVAFELKRRGWDKGPTDQQTSFLVALACRGWLVSWGDIHDAVAWLRWLGYPL